MAAAEMNDVLRNLYQFVRQQETCGLTDGQLVARFLVNREDSAFTALVHRHGPMVLNVCRRVLQNVHDTEDAFQATFLVLAVKAATIAPRDAVGAWLYGVACRTAQKAKSMTAKRRLKERQARDMSRDPVTPEQGWEEWHPLLDEELSRLPDKYRSAIVLCDLEGKTRREAAAQLGCPDGTLSSWLTRGRKMLARRLARRGAALSAGSLVGVLAQNAASASVRTSLVVATGKAATLFAAGRAAATGVISARVVALTEGVLKAMLLSKLRMVMAALLVAGLLGAGVAYRSYHAQAAEVARVEAALPNQDARPGKPEPPPDPPDAAVPALIAKVLKAHGGEEILAKIKTFTMRVKTASVNTNDRQDHHFSVQSSDQVRAEHRVEGRETAKIIVVKNGDKTWRKLNDGEATEGHVFPDNSPVTFLGPRALLRLKDPAMEVSVLGERLVGDTSLLGDRAAICVKLSRKDGKDTWPLHPFSSGVVSEVRLYFDKESNLLLKEEWDYQDIPYEIFYTDYKMVNGVAVARKLVHRGNGGVTYRSEVEFNSVDKLDAKLFQKP
jgi:RNA polymerase sigma factor (sigma-70 family)